MPVIQREVLASVFVSLLAAIAGLAVPDSNENTTRGDDSDIRVRCAAKYLEIARGNLDEAVRAGNRWRRQCRMPYSIG